MKMKKAPIFFVMLYGYGMNSDFKNPDKGMRHEISEDTAPEPNLKNQRLFRWIDLQQNTEPVGLRFADSSLFIIIDPVAILVTLLVLA
jgi:hypothetical protein